MDLQALASKIADFWYITIFTVDKEGVTLGQIIVGLVIFVLGLIFIKRISALFDKKILAKAQLDISTRHTLRSFSFYIMLVILVLFTLQMLSIPMTVFTVLGGALAIGVGFGSQNILNNFISGLIVMLEKPVRINDFIEIDQLTGRVQKIGARSTIVSSSDNTWHIVPNSFFLERSILNWTLSDSIIRSSISVGVAYGSSTKEVEKILYKIVKEEDDVLSHPEPIILFEDFADSSLNFTALYWVDATGPLEKRKVASKLRYKIDDAFKEAEITIAFPQQDVHLDTSKPIQIDWKK